VVCATFADVAVIVTVDVTGVGPEPPPLALAAPPPPQPKVSPSPARAASSRMYCNPRRFFLIKTHKPAAKAVHGRNGRELDREAADGGLMEIVSTVVAAAPEGVTTAGLKEQAAPVGSPEQAKLTAELKPYCGVIVSETVPGAPDWTVSEEAEAFNVKFGGGALATVRETVVVSVTPALVPATVSV
jgi:hypothetical protein